MCKRQRNSRTLHWMCDNTVHSAVIGFAAFKKQCTSFKPEQTSLTIIITIINSSSIHHHHHHHHTSNVSFSMLARVRRFNDWNYYDNENKFDLTINNIVERISITRYRNDNQREQETHEPQNWHRLGDRFLSAFSRRPHVEHYVSDLHDRHQHILHTTYEVSALAMLLKDTCNWPTWKPNACLSLSNGKYGVAHQQHLPVGLCGK